MLLHYTIPIYFSYFKESFCSSKIKLVMHNEILQYNLLDKYLVSLTFSLGPDEATSVWKMQKVIFK